MANRGELTVAQREAGPGVDVAEGVFDDAAAEVPERVDHGLTGRPVDFGELVAAAGVAVNGGCAGAHGCSKFW
jgi:hypothetical protein